MFNKYFNIEDNSDKAARTNAEAVDRLGKRLESISKAEIDSKDRVDITLKEYLTLKENCKQYEAKIRNFWNLISKLGIPVEVIDHIDNNSVTVEKNVNYMDFRTRYRITFDTYSEDKI